MIDPDGKEKIIELTEIVEEKPIKISSPVFEKRTAEPEGKKKEEPRPAKEGTLKNSSTKSPPFTYEKGALPEAKPAILESSPLTPSSFSPLLREDESEVRDLKKALEERTREWMASEGVQVMERVAREIFPRIAEEVLRKEIEKLKAESEEKE